MSTLEKTKPLTIRKLHPHFAAEVVAPDLRNLTDTETLELLRSAMDEYAVLVFRNQKFTNDEQLAFAERFDGTLHAKTSVAVVAKNRFGNEAITDGSNLDADGKIRASDDRARMISLSNRLWHTDPSFQDPPGRYSMLSGRLIPPVRADTDFADMRAAYDALDEVTKASLVGLRVHHTAAYSRQALGFEFSAEELEKLKGARHPLVRTMPRTGRLSLYLASHASHVIDWPVPEGRMLLLELMEHATQQQFVYTHEWQQDDFVIWDNRSTMHRARPFDDKKYRRDVRRTTTLDLPFTIGEGVSNSI